MDVEGGQHRREQTRLHSTTMSIEAVPTRMTSDTHENKEVVQLILPPLDDLFVVIFELLQDRRPSALRLVFLDDAQAPEHHRTE